jgi:hypothetical protein
LLSGFQPFRCLRSRLLTLKPAANTNLTAQDAALLPKEKSDDFEWVVEQFADLGILRYQIPGWDKLTVNQKLFVYYLTEAGYAGRDMIWDQNYRHNLEIRHALDQIVRDYKGNLEMEIGINLSPIRNVFGLVMGYIIIILRIK